MLEITLSAAAFVVAIIAFLLASASYRRAEVHRIRELERMCHELQADNVNYQDLYRRLYKSVHKLRTRLGRDDQREKNAAAVDHDLPDPKTDLVGWKDEMARRYPMGALTPGAK